MRRSGRDRKTPSPYDPSFEEKRYRDQLFVMNLEDKITTTNNLNSISVNAIFAQVFKMDPMQEAPGTMSKYSLKGATRCFTRE